MSFNLMLPPILGVVGLVIAFVIYTVMSRAPDGEAKERGIAIDHQRSRQVNEEDFETFDIIFAMDSSNYTNLIRLAPNEAAKAKVRLILNEAYPGENRQVPDPYTGGQSGFRHVYELLEEAVQSFIKKY